MNQNFVLLYLVAFLPFITFSSEGNRTGNFKTKNITEKPMQLKTLTPNLMVGDVRQTVEFYTKVLGFELLQLLPEKGTAHWAYVQKGSAKLMFQSAESLKAEFSVLESYPQGGAMTLFIQVEDPQKWYEAIKDKADVLKPYGVTPYNGANEFVIRDINGFILHFSDITFE